MNCRYAAIAISLAALLPLSAHADTRADVFAGMAQCAPIADNRAWLDCVYGAAQPMRALLGLPPAPQWHGPSALGSTGAPMPAPHGAGSEQMAAQPSQDFGLRAPAPVTSGEHARMMSYKFDSYHHFTVVLADGQVWSQLSGDTDKADWSKPASAYMVNISRGLLGSYNLRVVGEPGGFKVIRIATAKN